MSVTRFHIDSKLDGTAVLAVRTDFGPTRQQIWPTIDEEHFEVHELGDSWAEVTEGTASAWERAIYDWDARAGRVAVTTLDSKVFGPGGGWLSRSPRRPVAVLEWRSEQPTRMAGYAGRSTTQRDTALRPSCARHEGIRRACRPPWYRC